MDDAVKRGNEILRQFEKLNAGKDAEAGREPK
jgi:sn-glycerol 3-phosphate transport system substrate-binding protein